MSCQAFGDALAAAIDARVSGAYATLPPMHGASLVPRATRRWQNLVAALGLVVIVVLIVLGRQQKQTDEAKLSKAVADLEKSSVPATPSSRPATTPPVRPRPRPAASNAPDAAPADAAPQAPTLIQ